MKVLVLAEKPSVGKEIARVLNCSLKGQYAENQKYIVTWAFGHLVTLADPEVYDKKYMNWHLEDLPIIPDHFKKTIIRNTGKQYNTIKQLLSRGDINEVIIATDAGREGELVARWILAQLKWNKEIKRLWISSVTDQAIKKGFDNLKPGKAYESLYYAAVARAESDWLVGINGTRALTTKYNTNLSLGRVQTPTLAMVNENENQIRNFRPKTYYTVTATHKGIDFQYEDHQLFDENKVETLMKLSKSGVVESVETKEKKNYPEPLYDLTELQRDAFNKFGFTPKFTLNVMQSLYEKHKILTYPRTDSRYLPSDIVDTIPDRLKAIQLPDYRPHAFSLLKKQIILSKQVVQDEKVRDHHGIIPTEEPCIVQNLSSDEYKIYALVVKRFLEVLMPAYVYEETKVSVNLNGHHFIFKGRNTKSLGFKILSEKSSETQSIIFQKGKNIIFDQITSKKCLTEPPKRLNEATLLSAMENPSKFIQGNEQMKALLKETGGLGTVATRADIIEKLFNTGLIEKKQNSIYMTKKGKQLLDVAPEQLKSPLLTAQWESAFQKIQDNQLNYKSFVNDMKNYTISIVEEITQQKHTFKHDNLSTTLCPDCEKPMMTVKTKTGTSLVCQDNSCNKRIRISQVTNARCPECHKKMSLNGTGDSKVFICSCGYKEKLSSFENRKNNTQKSGNKNDFQNYLKKQEKENQKQAESSNPFAALKNLEL